MRLIHKILLITLISLWITFSLLFYYGASFYLKKEIQARLAEACASCRLEISSLNLSLWHQEISAVKIWFYSGDPEITAGEAKVERIDLFFSLPALLHKKILLTKIILNSPDVLITEGDGKSQMHEHKHGSTAWGLSGLTTEIFRGKFTYNRTYPPRMASIHVKDIEGTVEAWDSRDPAKNTEAAVTGILEHTGRFELTIKAPIFNETTQAEVDLKFKELNLVDINPFFEASEGILLAGSLYEGHANVKVMDRRLDAWVSARYLGLDIHFQKTAQRGILTAFFSNLIESLKVNTANIKQDAANQVRGVSLQRNSRESLVSFILRGMKDAALRVATGK